MSDRNVKKKDPLTPEQRSKCMSHIRSKDTKIEVTLRKALWHRGYRYRKNDKRLPGTPDIALTKYKIAVFCDGEFFHGKNWNSGEREHVASGKHGEFWVKKIEHNIEHDADVDQKLHEMGWTVIRFWGKQIQKYPDECIRTIEECILEQITESIEECVDSKDEA